MLREPDFGDLREAERCVRDIVALSTLPALWLGADTLRVAESLAAALFTTIGPDLIYVRLEESAGPLAIAQTGRYRTDAQLAATLGGTISDWARTHDPEELLTLPAPWGQGSLRITTRPLGHDAADGVLAAGFLGGNPSAMQHTLLGVAATQASLAVQNGRLLKSLRTSVAERERAEEALRDADRRKDEFLAILAHELRNPLAPLKNSLHLLQLVDGGATGLQPIREVMERQLNHLVRLVDDLLDISRITRGTLELRRESVELAAVVRHALETSDSLIKAAGHQVTLALPLEPLWLDGDAVRLAQILANLLNNAAKYTTGGGQIAVRAERRGVQAAICVRDNGAGIAPDLLPRIFEMFTRPRGSAAGGLGVGLGLALRLARMHGGTIEAGSDGPGKGAEFTVLLPLASAAPAAREGQPAAAARPLPRVLVADDNRDAADSLAALLQMLGAEVFVATDGAGAITAFERHRPRVVLLDIAMPELDGYQVARRIRAAAGDAPVSIIALTGWGQEAVRQRARDSGFDHHLVKPADLGALQALLASPPARAAAPG